MLSNQQILYVNIALFVAIALAGIRLVVRAGKSRAGKDGRYVMLTTAGRLCPALGCVAGGVVYAYTDIIRGVATLVAVSLLGVGLSFLGYRYARSSDGRS